MSSVEAQHVRTTDVPVEAIRLLDVSDVSVSYRAGRETFAALNHVSAHLERGETLAVVGESGAGKSTLARAILGLVPVSSGTISFDGQSVIGLKRRGRVALASRLQAVFQNPYSSLNPARPVGSALAEPLIAQKRSREEIDRRIAEMLERVGIGADAALRYPRQFSGGQRQRIAIARALMVAPDLVICDEALSALDLSVQAQIINLLLELKGDLGLAYLFIGHDLAVVRHIADRVVVLRRGEVVETGPVSQVCLHPSDPYTQALMESAPVPDPRVERPRLAARAVRRDGVR